MSWRTASYTEKADYGEPALADLPRHLRNLERARIVAAAAAHLPSLSASLDYARRECAAAAATIELLIDGFYAIVHQEVG